MDLTLRDKEKVNLVVALSSRMHEVYNWGTSGSIKMVEHNRSMVPWASCKYKKYAGDDKSTLEFKNKKNPTCRVIPKSTTGVPIALKKTKVHCKDRGLSG